MRTLTLGVVDDDPVLVREITGYVAKMSGYKLTLATTSAVEAANKIPKLALDILILDVEMPEMTGLELLKLVSPTTRVVLCSAHRNYACDGFEHKVADFLHKPFSFSRFFQRITDLNNNRYHAFLNGVTTGYDYFIVSVLNGSKNIKVLFEDIMYLEAKDSGTDLVLEKKRLFIPHPLKVVYQVLPRKLFVRISLSFVISTDYYEHYHDGKIKLRYVKEPLILGGRNMTKDFFDWLREHAI